MIGRSFKSVGCVAAVGGAALCCYMLSLQVATERAQLAGVESKILATKQSIRDLQTELGTRGRMQQLEQWNAEVLALSAPNSAQFLDSEMKLARFERPSGPADAQPPVRMASIETGAAAPKPAAAPPAATPAPAAPPHAAAALPKARLASAEMDDGDEASKPKLVRASLPAESRATKQKEANAAKPAHDSSPDKAATKKSSKKEAHAAAVKNANTETGAKAKKAVKAAEGSHRRDRDSKGEAAAQ
jgi:hypothetical protein